MSYILLAAVIGLVFALRVVAKDLGTRIAEVSIKLDTESDFLEGKIIGNRKAMQKDRRLYGKALGKEKMNRDERIDFLVKVIENHKHDK